MPQNVIYHFGLQKCPQGTTNSLPAYPKKTPKHTPSTMEIYKHDWAFSSEKAEQELGYTHIPLKEGLERTLDWIYKTVLVKV